GKSMSSWIDELDSPFYMGRMHAATALAQIGPPAKRAIPKLRHLLKDREPYVRWSAAVALGTMRAEAQDAIADLDELQRTDEVRTVQEAAAAAIKQIDPAAAARLGSH